MWAFFELSSSTIKCFSVICLFKSEICSFKPFICFDFYSRFFSLSSYFVLYLRIYSFSVFSLASIEALKDSSTSLHFPVTVLLSSSLLPKCLNFDAKSYLVKELLTGLYPTVDKAFSLTWLAIGLPSWLMVTLLCPKEDSASLYLALGLKFLMSMTGASDLLSNLPSGLCFQSSPNIPFLILDLFILTDLTTRRHVAYGSRHFWREMVRLSPYEDPMSLRLILIIPAMMLPPLSVARLTLISR